VVTELKELQVRLESLLAERAPELNVPGVAIGVWQGDEEFVVCHGVTSVENPLPIEDDTLFQIGSITKTFTGTAIMRLIEAGKLELDAPVRRYLPELQLKSAAAAEQVTVRQLLNHTAGWVGDQGLDGSGDDALTKFVEFLATVDQLTPPGDVISYNNAALNVAGRIIEKLTGQTFERALHDLVLKPLGMSNSFFPPDDIMTRRFAVGHGNKGRDDGSTQVIREWLMARSSAPAGGLVCGTTDMIRYGRFHLGDGTGANGERVLDASTLALMQQPSTHLRYDGESMGLTWHLGELGGTRTFGHDGGTPSGVARLLMVPERNFGATWALNSIGAGVVTLQREIQAAVFNQHLGLATPPPRRVNVTPTHLAAYAGVYDRGQGTTLHFTVVDDHLSALTVMSDELIAWIREHRPDVDLPKPKPIELWLMEDERFARSDQGSDSVAGGFVRNADGDVLGLRWSGRLALKIA
jgi:CubicO group peptidase (beta-lactamase class C family)